MKLSSIQQINHHIDSVAKRDNLPASNEVNLEEDFHAQQVALARCYEYDFNPSLAKTANLVGNSEFYQVRAKLEHNFSKYINNRFLSDFSDSMVVVDSSIYLKSLKKLIRNHPSFNHQYYSDFLATSAQFEDIRYYLAQESFLDPRFDDLIALIQIGIPVIPKMELANNYWDEMGNGSFNKVHTTLFSRVMSYFNVTESYILEQMRLPSLICGNLSSMLTIYRENYEQAIGYFGVTEYCVPSRFKYFIEGCRRIGVDDKTLEYHILHEVIDSKHAHSWFTEVIEPLIAAETIAGIAVTKGALLRLNSSMYYLDELLNSVCEMAEVI